MLKWAIERIEGKADAVETPIGFVPTAGSLDTDGLDVSAEELDAALAFRPEEWEVEAASIEDWYANFGEALPADLRAELDGLKSRLAS